MNEPLPDRDHVSRYCKPSTVGERGQPLASAFAIRSGEGYLSVNWLEYFGIRVGEPAGTEAALDRVRETLRRKGFRLRSNGRFALLNIGTVKTTIRRTFGRSLHVNHLPLPDDESHAGILGYTERDRMIAAEIRASVRAEDVRSAV
ncbi:MAG: hypothetical protein OXP28_07000 [Gammaproteobacteria bacterium]|nr:hypothetical protein [Gammaproteobacteria bacterium]MDE0224864.1 hypothetical protein [Gammaproteobacteria bacterium]